ncbi:hypothetical protein A3F66_03930 [candidate division TM6 bacterium RIFCSPHIGHO2_12_FULL_32_22]|nr:MAG: hypothetical protein A3F66_03930 [candidate division TM6 bacterium RIFCSPHIGHO2_12_FULL_32_22]
MKKQIFLLLTLSLQAADLDLQPFAAGYQTVQAQDTIDPELTKAQSVVDARLQKMRQHDSCCCKREFWNKKYTCYCGSCLCLNCTNTDLCNCMTSCGCMTGSLTIVYAIIKSIIS